MSYQALLFCPDDKVARVVTQVLTDLDFTVDPCNEPFAAVKKLMAQHFDAIVVDCDNEQNAALLFKSARNSGSNQNSLAVAVVEGQAGVAKAFRIGANLVLTKPINVEQSKGTLRVARGLLRKADATKPAGAATPETKPLTSPSSHAAMPTAAPMKPLAAAFTAPRLAPEPPAPPASMDTGFELESDPGPKPEAAEAALLESMPDPMAPARAFPAAPAKENPWQPVSKLAEPMASALRVAAEAAAKSSEKAKEIEPSLPDWGTPPALAHDPHPFPPTAPAPTQSTSVAAAPAPAKHDLKIGAQTIKFEESAATPVAEEITPEAAKAVEIPTEAPRIDPPTFAALAVKDHEEEEPEEGGKKAYVIIALVIVALIFTAYTVYQKMHPSSAPAPQPPAQQTTPAPAAAAPPAEGTTSAAETPSHSSATTRQEIVIDSAKPSAGISKKSVSDVTVTKFPEVKTPEAKEASPVEQESAPEPVIVKNSAPSTPKLVEAEVAPPTISTGPSDTKSLAVIAAVSATSVAKPVATTLKVSQGVSQGLLVKRVQPVYPEQALQTRLEGTVLLQANITKEGKISNVKVLKGDSILAKAAADAVKQWSYNPYFLNGEPVEIQTQISITFKLP